MDVFGAVQNCLSYVDTLLVNEERRIEAELKRVRKLRKQNAYNKSVGLPPVTK